MCDTLSRAMCETPDPTAAARCAAAPRDPPAKDEPTQAAAGAPAPNRASLWSSLCDAARRERVEGNRRPPAAARIAPAPAPPAARRILPLEHAPSPASSAGGADKASAEMAERRRKAELRKARNRESAQRSNQKRRLMIQALKDDIEAASSRETYLRARERMLREENTSLRKELMPRLGGADLPQKDADSRKRSDAAQS